MAAVNLEIGPIHGPDFGIGGQFGHANDAGIGNIHFPVPVFSEELEKIRVLLRHRKVQDQIAAANQPQPRLAGSEQEGEFHQNRLTGPEGGVCPQFPRPPGMVSVIEVQRRLEESGISNSSHGDVCL